MIMFRRICWIGIIFLTANIPFLKAGGIGLFWRVLCVPAFIAVNIMPTIRNRRMARLRYRICADGCELLIYFLAVAVASTVLMLAAIPVCFPAQKGLWLANLGCIILVEAITFWNGILRVYCTSLQIGLKWRIIGVVCGWMPVVHLAVLYKIIRVASYECTFENEKILKNQSRKDEAVCKTRYPILMVHGVFFRDFKYFNYWGRIPKELEENGATIYYGNHQSAASVADSAKEIAMRIEEIVRESGCEKVNIIAHSKGGLDCRYAISRLGMDRYVATLTTVNTPHRGCEFADYLLDKIPGGARDKVAEGYNAALRKLGDENPDFISAVTDLTATACKNLNEKIPDAQGVYYQSIGSKLNVASGGRFPLNFSHKLVRHFDGPNDGLVSETSFPWGESYVFLTTDERRGISHGDMIDLNREDIRGFDAREFYVSLVSELKQKGY